MNNGNTTPFKAEDVNWDELAGIGILKDELEMSGELDTLLRGEKTRVELQYLIFEKSNKVENEKKI